MFDIGWTELVVIAIVLIVVVGPKDLPPMLRAFGRMTSKMRGMAADFRHQFDEALREADLDEVRKTISDAQSLNPTAALRDAMNPLRQLGNEIKSDLQKAATPDKPAQPQPEPVQPAAEAVKAEAPADIAAKPAEVPAATANEPKIEEKKAESAGKPKAAPAPSKKAAAVTTKKAATKPPAKKTSSDGERHVEAKKQKARATSRKKGDA